MRQILLVSLSLLCAPFTHAQDGMFELASTQPENAVQTLRRIDTALACTWKSGGDLVKVKDPAKYGGRKAYCEGKISCQVPGNGGGKMMELRITEARCYMPTEDCTPKLCAQQQFRDLKQFADTAEYVPPKTLNFGGKNKIVPSDASEPSTNNPQ